MDAIHVYYIIVIASFISLLGNKKHLDSKLFLYFFLLMFAVIVVEAPLLFKWKRVGELFYQLYIPLELTLLGSAYKSMLKNKTVKRSIPYLIVGAWVLYVLQLQITFIETVKPIFDLYNYVVIIVFALLYFVESFSPPFSKSSIYRNAFFWINCGNLFFYAGTLLHGTLKDVMPDMTIAQHYIMYYISSAFNQSLYLLYLIGFNSKRLFK